MRKLAHFLLSLALWCLFFYYWHLVSGQAIGSGTVLAIKILIALAAFFLLATLWWVAHNLRIARGNRRLGERPGLPEAFERDVLGRPIEAPPLEILRASGEIEITVEDGRKIYRVSGEDVPAGTRPVAVRIGEGG